MTTAGTSAPYDPELAAALAAIPPDVLTKLSSSGIATGREMIATMFPVLTNAELRRDGAIDVDEQQVPGPAGDPDVSLLILRPVGRTAPVPAIYHIHGGGMIMGHNRFGIAELVDYVVELGVAVVSVEYRLSPEHPHPAPIEDCYAGLVWTAEHAADLGIDPSRLLLFGGSAGGGLAAALALLARDRGGPDLSHQILLCPMLDDREITQSSREYDGLGVWDPAANRLGWTSLLGDARGGPDVPPYAAPSRAADLSGLPPAYVDVGSAEIFRDEAIDYAARLVRAGVSVELHMWAGGFHGFESLAPYAAVTKDAAAARLNYLHRQLGV